MPSVYTMLQRNNRLPNMKCNAFCSMLVVKVPDHVLHVLLLHGLMGIHWNLPFISVTSFGVIYQKQYVYRSLLYPLTSNSRKGVKTFEFVIGRTSFCLFLQSVSQNTAIDD